MKKMLLTTVTLLLLQSASLDAQRPTAAQLNFFETHIRPALVKYCYECHSVEAGDSRAGLLVDTRIGLLQGGDGGPAVVPGDAESSLLWEAINWDGYEMPPSEKMPSDVIAKFKQWIDMGAPDPREREQLEFKTKIGKQDIAKARREHWAFRTPRGTQGTGIDELVARKLSENGLHAAPPADPYTLLRRIHFDLTGLPPTPAQIQAFIAAFNRDPEAAFRAKVDQLLDLPQYGERWGRHWLDVARYAESSGSRNVAYPHAWRYRNYVIDSFNDDTPYDRFIEQQIAGDLLPAKSDEQWQKNLIATGFLAIGLKHHDEKNPRKFMADMVDEQIDTMTQSVLGLTVACARCHDHKHDPIPTDDYYALAGILYSTKTFYGTDRIAQNHRPSELLLLPVPDETPAVEVENQQTLNDLKGRLANLDREMAGMRGKERRQVRNARNRVASQLESFNPDGTSKSFGMGVQDRSEMLDANIMLGGEVDQPAQTVPRGFVQILGNLNFTVDNNTRSGRLELAKAMTSKNNPLTARVMANRIWMHLLGRPLVETPSNFGLSGTAPKNQQLLDYLAVRFMDNDWSMKSLIREIVLSDTYRRSSRYLDENYAVDPDNKLLWRANPRAMDAESLRDAMLSLSGNLNLNRPSAIPAQIGGRRRTSDSEVNVPHRSVYLPIVRDKLPESLDLFDFPDPNLSSPGRTDSIVPTQALYLMNDDFVADQAQGMADTLRGRFESRGDQVRMAFLWVYGRPASDDELRAGAQFFRDFKPSASAESLTGFVSSNELRGRAREAGRARTRSGPRGRLDASNRQDPVAPADPALAVFCQTLMASAPFRILN